MKDPKRRIRLDDEGDPEKAARDAALRAEAERAERIARRDALFTPWQGSVGKGLDPEEVARLAEQRANRNAGSFPRVATRNEIISDWAQKTGPMLAGLFGKPLAEPTLPTSGTDFRMFLRRGRGARAVEGSAAQRKLLETCPPPFNSIETRKGVMLSVQAGPQNASEPRRALADLYAYESWELAVFPEGGVWARLGAPFSDFWPGPLATYVPTQDVQDIFDALIDGAPIFNITTGEQVA